VTIAAIPERQQSAVAVPSSAAMADSSAFIVGGRGASSRILSQRPLCRGYRQPFGESDTRIEFENVSQARLVWIAKVAGRRVDGYGMDLSDILFIWVELSEETQVHNWHEIPGRCSERKV
jgi:hypothetical protein